MISCLGSDSEIRPKIYNKGRGKMKKKYLRLQFDFVKYNKDVLFISGITDLGDGDNGGVWPSYWNL